jgi:uncharacterized Zn finger protein
MIPGSKPSHSKLERRLSMADEVKVPKEVYEGIEELKKSGRTRLSDIAGAITALEEMGQYTASDWVQNNYEGYRRGLDNGFVPE